MAVECNLMELVHGVFVINLLKILGFMVLTIARQDILKIRKLFF